MRGRIIEALQMRIFLSGTENQETNKVVRVIDSRGSQIFIKQILQYMLRLEWIVNETVKIVSYTANFYIVMSRNYIYMLKTSISLKNQL